MGRRRCRVRHPAALGKHCRAHSRAHRAICRVALLAHGRSPTAAPTAGIATPTRVATRPKPTAAPAAACPDLRARIIYPANGATISGVTNFLGTANVPDQAYYKFEYKPASSPTWQYLTQVDGKTVTDDKLMDFYTTTIAPGRVRLPVDRGGPVRQLSRTVRDPVDGAALSWQARGRPH